MTRVWYCPFFVSSAEVVRTDVQKMYAELRPIFAMAIADPGAQLPETAIVVERNDTPPPGMHKLLFAELIRMAGYRVPEGTGDAHMFVRHLPVDRAQARKLVADWGRQMKETRG